MNLFIVADLLRETNKKLDVLISLLAPAKTTTVQTIPEKTTKKKK